MLYLIGLGLNEKGYSKEAYDVILKADKIYIESYTVNYPYDIKEMEKQFKKKFISADREFVESLKILDEAKKQNVALLIYGSPLMATTHSALIQEAKKSKVKYEVIHNASIFDAVAETGLQLYKFGKITSMPNFGTDSYMNVVKDNLKIKAHSLILVDIDMSFDEVLRRLVEDSDKKGVEINKIIVCSRLGNKDSRIFYKRIQELKNQTIKKPFCIIIPSDLHFVEGEILEEIK